VFCFLFFEVVANGTIPLLANPIQSIAIPGNIAAAVLYFYS